MFVCRFGTFEVNAGSRQLFKAGREIHLQEQPMRLLTLLLDRPGELHTREELQKRLWPNETFVEFDDGLNTAIQKIRQVLGDEARNPRFVETVPRQGYRFIAPVQVVPPPAAIDRTVETPAQEHPVAAAVADERRADNNRVDWRVAAVAAALAGAGFGWVMSPKPAHISSSPAIRLSIMPPPGVELRPGIRGGSAISPDGAP